MKKLTKKTRGKSEPISGVVKADYNKFLNSLKTRIKSTQIKASLAVNKELVGLYWLTGQDIVQKQIREGWGKSVVKRLSCDLRQEFPELRGFSYQNMWRMRAFYLAWKVEKKALRQAYKELGNSKLAQSVRVLEGGNLPHPVGEIPWGHNLVLFEKIKDLKRRIWYACKTVENGWSRPVLIHQIESQLFERQAKTQKLTNFSNTLPDSQSDLAHEMIKDPYNFGFLSLSEKVKEKDLHSGLLKNLREFLVELGVGFAFVGSEYHLNVGNQDFYIDLLFYHLKLRCFVVVELKTVAFQPEFSGKMNFYLSAVDAQLRHEDDQPTIGMILCKSKNKTIAEYALRDSSKPMGVSAYKLVHSLPNNLKGQLPSIAELKGKLK